MDRGIRMRFCCERRSVSMVEFGVGCDGGGWMGVCCCLWEDDFRCVSMLWLLKMLSWG